MRYPLSDLLDRISITRLKKQRTGQQTRILQHYTLMQSLEKDYDTDINVNKYIQRLYQVNGRIWDLQSDIRQEKEEQLGLQQVGRRAIKIRQINKQRIDIKNQVTKILGIGFPDIKVNHGST